MNIRKLSSEDLATYTANRFMDGSPRVCAIYRRDDQLLLTRGEKTTPIFNFAYWDGEKFYDNATFNSIVFLVWDKQEYAPDAAIVELDPITQKYKRTSFDQFSLRLFAFYEKQVEPNKFIPLAIGFSSVPNRASFLITDDREIANFLYLEAETLHCQYSSNTVVDSGENLPDPQNSDRRIHVDQNEPTSIQPEAEQYTENKRMLTPNAFCGNVRR